MRQVSKFRPHELLVERLSFSIDQYFLTLSYAAIFLALAWHTGLINSKKGHTCLLPKMLI